jgi:ornithine cyclodeaminase/alanine dehydrogenase-like protein (mu-crystallin family)
VKIITLDEINDVLPSLDLIPAIEAGFAAYSAGDAVVPPVGELLLEKGDVHIKCGFLKNDAHYVIKIASGFYGNSNLGLPSSNGMMLLFSQQTGELVSILLDEGRLTDTRTAVAGAIAAKHLAPKSVSRIGIVGSGIQAREQLIHLRPITTCRDVLVWGRGEKALSAYRSEMEEQGCRVETTLDAASILSSCNLIITCTPATEPLLSGEQLQAGTHITAVGSDTAEKHELDSAILGRADLVVADSIAQCLLRGEIFRALNAGAIQPDTAVELGRVISGDSPGRTSEEQITVADLTGVAVQDIKIAAAVYAAVS